MRQITDISELRTLQMGILDHVHHYCMEHGLCYFLSSGTLIGAVRQGGYKLPFHGRIVHGAYSIMRKGCL